MKETNIQQRVVDAVERAGGAADKLTNKFKRGVADLSIKLVGYPLLYAECKLEPRPVKQERSRLDVTNLQRNFLLKYDKAGQPTCIMSFLHSRVINYQARTLWVALYPPLQKVALVEDHIIIPKGQDFDRVVVMAIERYLMEIQK